MRDCTIKAFDGCDCSEGECKSATVPLSKWNDMSGVFTQARVQIAFIAWVTITCLIGFGAYQLHQIDKQEQIARNV